MDGFGVLRVPKVIFISREVSQKKCYFNGLPAKCSPNTIRGGNLKEKYFRLFLKSTTFRGSFSGALYPHSGMRFCLPTSVKFT